MGMPFKNLGWGLGILFVELREWKKPHNEMTDEI